MPVTRKRSKPAKKAKVGDKDWVEQQRQEKLRALCSQYPHYILKGKLLKLAALVGMVLGICGVFIYSDTWVPSYIPALMLIIPVFIAYPLFKNIINRYCSDLLAGEVNGFVHCIYHFFTSGCVLLFFFLWTNAHFSDRTERDVKLKVQSAGYQYGRNGRHLDVIVNYGGLEGHITFRGDYVVHPSSYVLMKVEKGYWGFDVITGRSLMQD